MISRPAVRRTLKFRHLENSGFGDAGSSADGRGSQDSMRDSAQDDVVGRLVPTVTGCNGFGPISYSDVLSGKQSASSSGNRASVLSVVDQQPNNAIDRHEEEEEQTPAGNEPSASAGPLDHSSIGKKLQKKRANSPTRGATLGDLIFASFKKQEALALSKKSCEQFSENQRKPTTAAAVALKKAKEKGSRICGNALDSSSPVFHKGKTRENRVKKPTALKRALMKDREQQKRNAADRDGGAEALTLAAENQEGGPNQVERGQQTVTTGEPTPSFPSQRRTIEQPPFVFPREVPPHSRKFRSYCDNAITEPLNVVVTEFLVELKRLQDRLYQKDKEKARLKRRVACGFHEVEKHLKLDNAKCVIMTPDIERSFGEGSLDSKVGSVLTLCRDKGVVYCFALNRWTLGKAVKKRTASCVVVLNFQAAEALHNRLLDEREKAAAEYRRLVELTASAAATSTGVQVQTSSTLSEGEPLVENRDKCAADAAVLSNRLADLALEAAQDAPPPPPPVAQFYMHLPAYPDFVRWPAASPLYYDFMPVTPYHSAPATYYNSPSHFSEHQQDSYYR